VVRRPRPARDPERKRGRKHLTPTISADDNVVPDTVEGLLAKIDGGVAVAA